MTVARKLFPALLGAAILAAPLEAQDGGAIVGRAANVYASLGSLRADSEQRIADSLIGTFDSKGSLVQAGQNLLAMRFSDPAGDAIIVDGRQVWVYTPSTAPGQVIRMPLPSGPVHGLNVLSWILDRPRERYRIRYLRSEPVAGRTADVVELIPRSADMPFSKAIVWIDRDDALPRKLEISERRGGTRTITLSRIRTNDQVSEQAFAFTVPEGVRIIDQR